MALQFTHASLQISLKCKTVASSLMGSVLSHVIATFLDVEMGHSPLSHSTHLERLINGAVVDLEGQEKPLFPSVVHGRRGFG